MLQKDKTRVDRANKFLEETFTLQMGYLCTASVLHSCVRKVLVVQCIERYFASFGCLFIYLFSFFFFTISLTFVNLGMGREPPKIVCYYIGAEGVLY